MWQNEESHDSCNVASVLRVRVAERCFGRSEKKSKQEPGSAHSTPVPPSRYKCAQCGSRFMSLIGFKNHQANKMGNEYCYRYYKRLNEEFPKEEEIQKKRKTSKQAPRRYNLDEEEKSDDYQEEEFQKKRKTAKKTSRRYNLDEEEKSDDYSTWNRVLSADFDADFKGEEVQVKNIGSLREQASRLARKEK